MIARRRPLGGRATFATSALPGDVPPGRSRAQTEAAAGIPCSMALGTGTGGS